MTEVYESPIQSALKMPEAATAQTFFNEVATKLAGPPASPEIEDFTPADKKLPVTTVDGKKTPDMRVEIEPNKLLFAEGSKRPFNENNLTDKPLEVRKPPDRAVEAKLPETPPDRPRRPPDTTSLHGTAKTEYWNYPDGTSESRHTDILGYMSLSRYDANGKRTEKLHVFGSHDLGGQILEITRANGSIDRIVGSDGFASAAPNSRRITRPDGTVTLDTLPGNLADRMIQNYRQIIMR